MKRVLFILLFICSLGIFANAENIDGYFIFDGHQYFFFAEGTRDYTEIGAKAGEIVEITLTAPASAVFDWGIDKNGTSTNIEFKSADGNYVRIRTSSADYDRYCMLYITTGNDRLAIKMYIGH